MKNKQQQITKKDVLNNRVRRIERYISTHTGDIKAKSAASAFVPITAGATYFLSPCGLGDTSETRTGDVINLHHFTLGALFKMTATCSVRVVVFMDRFNMGSIPGLSSILDSADVVSPLNYSNTVAQKRFRILEDYTEHFSLNGSLSASRRKRIPINVKVRYLGANDTSAEARSNNIYAAVVTDTATAGQLNFYTRMEYTDE